MGYPNQMSNCIALSVLVLVLLQMTVAISAGSIRTRITAEIGAGRGVMPKLSRNFQRISRNTVAAQKPESQPESRAEHQSDVTVVTITASTMSTNEEMPEMKPADMVVIDAESPASPPTTVSSSGNGMTAEMTTDAALMPMWDSTKIETPKMTKADDSSASDEDEPARQPELIPSFVDRKKEAERLRKVVSAFHLNRVLGTTAPTPGLFGGFPITAAPSTRQRALGFPLLITNTLDNFHHQLDWSRFGSFSAELE
ncbi:uncharacterized protein LOC124208237 isoform X1 [Daphnia pulex]|uniref:uncharacterized protein LOC124208237 isoform X1 n=1 Tax=Daphnia pulex TaxID=6669 RepID=UPI001EDDB6F5|nr:uncharacterized protein LOC124208237 isoform X1 [Daphnia pulex]